MDNFKVWVKYTLIILGVLFILLMAYVLGEESFNKKTDTLSPDFKHEYMLGCLEGNAGELFCECTYNYLNNTLTNEQFIKIAIESLEEDAKIPNEIMKAVESCFEYN